LGGMADESKVRTFESVKGTNREISSQSSATVLRNALLSAITAFCDYGQYSNRINRIITDFDESLESLNPNTCLFIVPEAVDKIVLDCTRNINRASAYFSDLAEQVEESCHKVMETVLSAPPAIQRDVLGRAYSFIPEELDSKLNELLSVFNSTGFNIVMFLKYMEKAWKDYEIHE
jgi:hypothetical protein